MYAWIDKICFNENGLIPAIAQDYKTGKVLMLAWMSKESLLETISSKKAVYFSRSRSKLWMKGEASGHFQTLHELRLDCDNDTILLKVKQEEGVACHTGRESCFFQILKDDKLIDDEPIIKSPSLIYNLDK
ncbi:MAG: phosphoribosyl-AMP cyclohydrolase [Burkholderiaceae bacterium]